MGQIDMLGQRSPLKSGPADETLDTFKSGTVESFAEMAPLRRSNNPLGQFTGQSMGTVEMVGGDVGKLSRKPHRGYEGGTPNNSTPINQQDMNPDTSESY